MNDQIRRCLVALLSLGLASGYSLAAAAQEIIEETYTVERYADDDDWEADPPAVVLEDDADDPGYVVADRDGVAECAARFRSFDPSTGTYVTYNGETRTCPYLN